MDIRSLGYIGLDVADLEAWRHYAGVLGAMVTGDTGGDTTDSGLRIRIDDRPFRILARSAETGEGLAFAGWELADAAALEQAVTELEEAGCAVRAASEQERSERGVRGLVRTSDPSGFTLELFHGTVQDHRLFVSPAGVSGFVTGPLGMGHIVLGTPRPAEALRFYTEVMGFRVSDYWRPGDDDVVFLHCNPRHHSLALVAAARPELYHFMLEVETLDDVGRTLERHRGTGRPISMGLGRHTNDRMVSFYSRTPSGFDVELGCGGLLIDDRSWVVSEITAPSSWGHHPPGEGPGGT